VKAVIRGYLQSYTQSNEVGLPSPLQQTITVALLQLPSAMQGTATWKRQRSCGRKVLVLEL